MIEIEPALHVVQFAGAPVGSVVQFDGRRGFVARNARQPPDKIIAAYDQRTSRFLLEMSVQSQVFVFRDQLVLTPNLQSAFENGRPSAASTSELFLDGDRALVVLHIEGGFRLLDLATGIFESTQHNSLMPGFKEWAVNARMSGGELLPLIDAGPGFGSALGDEGLTEPNG